MDVWIMEVVVVARGGGGGYWHCRIRDVETFEAIRECSSTSYVTYGCQVKGHSAVDGTVNAKTVNT